VKRQERAKLKEEILVKFKLEECSSACPVSIFSLTSSWPAMNGEKCLP